MNWDNPVVQAASIAALVAAMTSLLTQLVQGWSLKIQAQKLAAEYKTLDAAERAIHHFLSLSDLPYRAFPMIQHYIGGFEPNELRRMLVRSGAVRFSALDGTEMWALVERTKDPFQEGSWRLTKAPLRGGGFTYDELFPTAFKNKEDR